MFGPRRTIILSHLPVPSNRYPAHTVPNYSLGRETTNMAIYVPLAYVPKNAKRVENHMSEVPKGGRSTDLIAPPQLIKSRTTKEHSMVSTSKVATHLDGKGSSIAQPAFKQPVQVFGFSS